MFVVEAPQAAPTLPMALPGTKAAIFNWRARKKGDAQGRSKHATCQRSLDRSAPCHCFGGGGGPHSIVLIVKFNVTDLKGCYGPA